MTAPSRADEAQQLLGAAERDRVVFTILTRDAQAPAEIALFLAQQALEKSIKAVLAARSVVFRRTHDLLLEALALAAGLTLPVSHDLLARLGPYAVEFRHLGATVVPAVSLVEAADAANALRDWAAAVVLTAVRCCASRCRRSATRRLSSTYPTSRPMRSRALHKQRVWQACLGPGST